MTGSGVLGDEFEVYLVGLGGFSVLIGEVLEVISRMIAVVGIGGVVDV